MFQPPEFTLPSLPARAGAVQRLRYLTDAALALIAAQISQRHPGLVLLIVQDSRAALRLQAELPHFTPLPVTLFPDWETLPYDSFSPDPAIISERLTTLYHLPTLARGIVIVPITTLMQRLAPRHFLNTQALLVHSAQPPSRERLREQLLQAGYQAVNQVNLHGEFAVRGSLLDLFPMGSNLPYRLDFFDQTLESIHTFEIDSQRSQPNAIDSIQLLPAHEFATDPASIEQFRSGWRERFPVRREAEHLYQQISHGIWPAGIEYWQPLFFAEILPSLLAYLPANTLLLTVGDQLEPSAQRFQQEIEQRFDSRRHDPLRPLLPPDALWLRVEQLFAEFKGYPRVHLQQPSPTDLPDPTTLPMTGLPDLRLQASHKVPLLALQRFSQTFQGTLLFSVESRGRREVLAELLRAINLIPTPIQQFSEATSASGPYVITTPCQQGFIVKGTLAFITEADLLGERLHRPASTLRQPAVNLEALVHHLVELTPGQAVVHLQHGIGRYAGLTTLEAGGITAEYLVLHYADAAKLYVPVSSLHLISRYSGGAEAPLHKLGSDSWSRVRQKALEKVRDVAAELLDIYAQRAAKPGFAYQLDPAQYQLFCQAFPFDETVDQAAAIQAVLNDMGQPTTMDRLICGDVGFGKTEVALRAAFLAVSNHKQVLLLVPTTLLAEQHAEKFRDRFANWPIHIEVLSRFRTTKEQQQVISQLAQGTIDIVIGTHKLLQTHLAFKDLGLLIIDEEHRFGVRQKEQIKARRATIDILTLTATPIPRTLNMAMHGMRDLSIIATPPTRRLAVKTFVQEYHPEMIREALLREIMRGGQIYYLHNEIKTIGQTAEKLRKLLPEVRIGIGHGQMGERELERVMSDFYHQRFNLLLCSTIIETGLDIPTVNTIIIERADRFGLAQLHQLRGRVGRSHHQAYAYLLTPSSKRLTTDARKRLEAIGTLGGLGVGFALASHDLDIRGAGELLGADQSGQINAIGFSLYQELLESAVSALKKGQEPTLALLTSQQAEIELRLPALIPEVYIPSVNARLSWYKRLASADDQQTLQALKSELIDRFGALPTPLKHLLEISRLRQLAKPLAIRRIEGHERGGTLDFHENTPLDPRCLIALLQRQPAIFSLKGATRLQFTLPLLQAAERLHFISELLSRLTVNLATSSGSASVTTPNYQPPALPAAR